MISTNCESHQSSFSHTILKKIFSTSSNKDNIFWPFHLSKYILKKAFQLPWTKTRFSDPLWHRAGTLCYDSSQRQVHLPKERFLGEQRNAEYCSLSSEGAEVSHMYLFDIFFWKSKGPITISWYFEISFSKNQTSNSLRIGGTLAAGVGDFWLEIRAVVKILSHPWYPRTFHWFSRGWINLFSL